MALTKKQVSPADIEAEIALELPDRETLSCGNYLVVFQDSFNFEPKIVYVDQSQDAVNLCNLFNNWFNNWQILVLQNNSNYQSDQWYSCTIYQKSNDTSIVGIL